MTKANKPKQKKHKKKKKKKKKNHIQSIGRIQTPHQHHNQSQPQTISV